MWWLLAFLLLVALPVVVTARETPQRLRDVRAGLRGVVYVPVLLVVLLVVAALAWELARLVPLLRWGWLGANVVVAPLAGLLPAAEGGAGGGTVGATPLLGPAVTLAVFVPFVLLAFVLFNWYEEAYYRGSLRDVAVWAALHLVMGIPLFAVLPIFATGLVYKLIRDRRGLRTAYVAHLGTNTTLLALLVVGILLGPAV
ncbi:MAG: hypothetical protein ABEJ30_05565 [Halorientalis sp.]